MISLYSGTPGSGKSLHAASVIWNRLRFTNKPVVGNFPINPNTRGYERYTYIPNDKMTAQALINYAERYWAKHTFRGAASEGTILLVIDEAQVLFNSREGLGKDDKKARMEYLSFFQQHRKMGYDVLVISQNDRLLDRQIRSCLEYEVKHRKIGSVGWFGKLMSFFVPGDLYIGIRFFYGMNMRLDSETFRGKQRYFALYDSYGTFARREERNAARDGGKGVPPPARVTFAAPAEPVRVIPSAPKSVNPSVTAPLPRIVV